MNKNSRIRREKLTKALAHLAGGVENIAEIAGRVDREFRKQPRYSYQELRCCVNFPLSSYSFFSRDYLR